MLKPKELCAKLFELPTFSADMNGEMEPDGTVGDGDGRWVAVGDLLELLDELDVS